MATPEILLLCEYAALNGAERSMLATLDGLKEAGFRLTVLGPGQGPLARAVGERQVPLESLDLQDSSGGRLPQASARQVLAEAIGRHRPALVHANSLSMGRLSGPVVRDLGVPSVAHLRDIVGLSRQAAADLNCHDRLLAVSQAVRSFHVAGGLDPQKTHALYNGVDLERFCPHPSTGCLHRELGLPADARLAATIGQIGMRKGQDLLVEAAAMLAGEFVDVHWLLIGQRHSEKTEAVQFENDLRRFSAGPLAGRIHFLGRRDDVERILSELTILVHPARQEPLGRVLLEAAAAGAAVVATDVGGTSEIFPPGNPAARLVPPGEPRALATAMRELLRDERLRAQLGGAARRRALEAFDIRIAAANLAEHYRQVLNERATGGGRSAS